MLALLALREAKECVNGCMPGRIPNKLAILAPSVEKNGGLGKGDATRAMLVTTQCPWYLLNLHVNIVLIPKNSDDN